MNIQYDCPKLERAGESHWGKYWLALAGLVSLIKSMSGVL